MTRRLGERITAFHDGRGGRSRRWHPTAFLCACVLFSCGGGPAPRGSAQSGSRQATTSTETDTDVLHTVSLGSAQPAAAPSPNGPLSGRSFVHEPRWRLYATEYARSRAVRESRLVRGASRDARVDMSWYYFVAVGHGRVVLIDCGTDALSRPGRRALRSRWSIDRAIGVAEALEQVGLSPRDVTDIVLTHFHWDHVGGLSAFSGATVYAHRDEWRRVPRHLREPVEREERLRAVVGRTAQLLEGLSTREAGHHTAHQRMVEIRCPTGPVIIAGDAAYLYRNIEAQLPVTITTDRAANLADVARAVEMVGRDRVLPGHDPALFTRYPSPAPGVAVICG